MHAVRGATRGARSVSVDVHRFRFARDDAGTEFPVIDVGYVGAIEESESPGTPGRASLPSAEPVMAGPSILEQLDELGLYMQASGYPESAVLRIDGLIRMMDRKVEAFEAALYGTQPKPEFLRNFKVLKPHDRVNFGEI